MVNHMSDRNSAHDEESRLLEAGLRAAFEPDSSAACWAGGGVLAALEESSGVSARILLCDEPDEPTQVITPRPAETATAARLTGRYQIAGEIARGGVGIVLRGRDIDLGREVALKVLRDDHAANPIMVRRLVEEAQIGGQLQHPGVLPIYDLGLDAGRRPYFSMKLFRGRTLAAELQDRAGPSQDRQRFLTTFERVCQTMAYAHTRGVVHRDLKPSNIMVGSFGEVQVVDWGLAKVLAQGGVEDERREEGCAPEGLVIATVRTASPGSQSEVGSVLGTPSYMPPEQARGEVDNLDERSDVFALGAILCEILTGRPPYSGKTRALVLRQAAEGRLDDACARLERCDAEEVLIQLAKRCLAPARHDRPRDAGHVAREITAYHTAVQERARAAELAAAEARARAASERRQKYLILALAFAILVAAVSCAWSFWNAEHEATKRFEEEKRHLREMIGISEVLEAKGRYMLKQVAEASPAEAKKWVDAAELTQKALNVLASSATDDGIRNRDKDLLAALREQEA